MRKQNQARLKGSCNADPTLLLKDAINPLQKNALLRILNNSAGDLCAFGAPLCLEGQLMVRNAQSSPLRLSLRVLHIGARLLDARSIGIVWALIFGILAVCDPADARHKCIGWARSALI